MNSELETRSPPPITRSILNPVLNEPDSPFDLALRPAGFDEFHGQTKVKDQLMVMVEAAKLRNEPLDHALLCGPPGLGKTTLANLIANAMGTKLHTTSGPQIERAGDLAGILTNMGERDLMFIDEIHRLHASIEEYLYPAIEDFRLDIIIDQGPKARTIRIDLPPFTLVGATTRAGMLTAPMRSRFGIPNRLDYYTADEIQHILMRSARLMNVPMEAGGAREIARRSRGTPRIANHLLRWVRDYALVKASNEVTEEVASKALIMRDIDEDGLDDMDIRVLEALVQKFDGGPVGLGSIAVAVGEDTSTLEDVHEPYLVMMGYVKRTPRGRVAMPSAYRKLGLVPPHTGQTELF